MKLSPIRLCLLILVAFGSSVAVPSLVHAAPLNYSTATTISLTSPTTTFTIVAGSVADMFQVNATSVLATLSQTTGGSLTLTSASYDLTIASSSGGGTAALSCNSGVASLTLSQTTGQTTYTIAPASSQCTTSSNGGGSSGGAVVSTGGGGSAYTLTVNSGAATTATTSVVLSLYGTAAYTMEVSNTSTFAGATWIPFATTAPWTLSPAPGIATVYVQYRSVGGTIVGSAQASIDLVSAGASVATSSSLQPSYSTSSSPRIVPALSSPPPSATATLQAQLQSLLAQLANLSAQSQAQGIAGTGSAGTTPLFLTALQLRDSGPDVTSLQTFLAGNPALYPEGKVTGYFGSLTLKAVQRFQGKYGIAKPGQNVYGYVGPATRAKLNALIQQGLSP